MEEQSSLVKTEQKNELKVEAHSDAETGTLSALCNVTVLQPRSGETARQNFLGLVRKSEDRSVEKYLFFASDIARQ